MKILKSIKLVGKIALLAGAAILPISEAFAKDRRVSGSACHFVYDNAGSNLYVGAYVHNKSTTNNGYAIVCPAATDSYLSHSSVARLNIHGYEQSGESNYSRACVKHYNNSGNVCGVNRYWGGGYSGGANIDASKWRAHPYSFPYVFTNLDRGGRLYGMWYRN